MNLPYVRFRFELYDYDPNQEDLYEDKSIGELEEMISSLDNEEEDAIFAIKEKYLKLHEMYSRYRELKRPEQNSSCPDISGYKSINDQNLCLKWLHKLTDRSLRRNSTHKSFVENQKRRSLIHRSLESLNKEEAQHMKNRNKTCFVQ